VKYWPEKGDGEVAPLGFIAYKAGTTAVYYIDNTPARLLSGPRFRTGLVCLTGTGIVPPDDFSLQEGDVVEIEIEKIGVLRNPVGKLR